MPMLDTFGPSTGRGVFRATPAVTGGWSHPEDEPNVVVFYGKQGVLGSGGLF